MDVLKDILDNLSDSITIIDDHGQIVLFNDEAERIHKMLFETPLVIGAVYLDLQTPERRKIVEEIIDTVRRQHTPVKNFAEHRTLTGTTTFLELNFVPIMGRNGALRYINVIAHDITSRKIFERKLRSATADMQKVLDQAYAVVINIDAQGYVIDWNEHVAAVTGWSKREMLSQRFREVLLDEANYSQFDVLMSEITANRPVARIEIPLRTRSGGEATVALSATPRLNANGHVVGATLVGQDITELCDCKRQLTDFKEATVQDVQTEPTPKDAQTAEMKSHFISIASHEFRSPLSSIDYAANFIKQHAGRIGRKKLNEKVAVIEKHVSYMSHLLEDVLNYSRAEHDRIRVVTEPVCLRSFIREAVDEATAACRHSHAVKVCADNPGVLQTDRKLLRNIISNLLSNAIKFSPEHSEVQLTVLHDDHAVTFEVVDQGVGIPPDELDAIFEPFVRGKAVNDIQGTGLGLSIVKRAVTLLNGTMNVESAPGEGTAFRVTIPHP